MGKMTSEPGSDTTKNLGRPLLNAWDSNWVLGLFIAFLPIPAVLTWVATGASTADEIRSIVMIFAGTIAAVSLFLAMISFRMSRADKAWDDLFRMQECLYKLNREWVEDEIRLLKGAIHLQEEGGSVEALLGDAVKSFKPKNRGESLSMAYKAMYDSGLQLRKIARARATLVKNWPLEGMGPDVKSPSSNTKNSRRHLSNPIARTKTGYQDTLRVLIRKEMEPEALQTAKQIEKHGHSTRIITQEDGTRRLEAELQNGCICPRALSELCVLVDRANDRRIFFSKRNGNYLIVKKGTRNSWECLVKGKDSLKVKGDDQPWTSGSVFHLPGLNNSPAQ